MVILAKFLKAQLFMREFTVKFPLPGMPRISITKVFLSVLILTLLLTQTIRAATLTGSFAAVPQGSNVNLTTEGNLDWVHWGLFNATSLNRKQTVTPQISDFAVLYDTNSSYADAYQYADNYNGYTWSDGTQETAITNTTTGVYVVGPFNMTEVNGFQFTVPADTTSKTLKVYVGAYAARGRFQAILSNSAITYTNTALVNSVNGPGGVYTIQFAADSPNQTLTIRWTVAMRMRADGNVTLQAATLSAGGVNNPPFGRITFPAQNANFVVPGNIALGANAFDPDGTISKVEFLSNGTEIGEASASPYSFTALNLPVGRYQFTTRPLDNGGAASFSHPVEVFVHSSGGTLTGSVAVPPSTVNLSDEGNVDWVHYGLINATNVNRKTLAQPQISNFNKIGTNTLSRLTDYAAVWNWNDGTPISTTNNTSTGVFVSGITNGFEFSVPADPSLKTLRLYVGLYGGAGNFQAWLSDFSAPAFTDRTLSNAWDSSYVVYTLNYASASVGQSLHVRYCSDYLFDQEYGNVSLAAATLNGAAPAMMFSAQGEGNSFNFRFKADAGRTYIIQYTDSLNPTSWTTLTTIFGSGVEETVTDSASHPHRFYRIKTQ